MVVLLFYEDKICCELKYNFTSIESITNIDNFLESEKLESNYIVFRKDFKQGFLQNELCKKPNFLADFLQIILLVLNSCFYRTHSILSQPEVLY